MKYVALLRGINVGGNNKVEMKKLKLLFEELGFFNVATYINSGNVVFETSSKTNLAKIEPAINSRFNLNIKTLVIAAADFAKIVTSIPKNWLKRKGWRQNVMFLWPEIDSEKLLDEIESKAHIDEVKYVKGVLFWATDKDYLSRSGGQKLVGSKIYNKMTVRNLNTTLRLWELLSTGK